MDVTGRPRHGSKHWRPRRIFGKLTWVGLLFLLVLLNGGSPAQAHAELERASPAVDALLSAPPQRLEFWFTERIAADASPPLISVLDQSGAELVVTQVAVDPNDPRHVTAQVADIAAGTYTVNWLVLSADDGHTLSGTYGFRVGSGRAPGAATVAGERPQPWAVITRWITFLAASLMVACLLWISLAWRAGATEEFRRHLLVALVAALTGLGATLLEPWLQTRFPRDGALAPSLTDAIDGLPDVWWLRPRGFLLALVAIMISLVLNTKGRRLQLPVCVGAAGGLVAILGLSLTTHAAARQRWEWISTISVVAHEWAIGLWVGGLAALALFWFGTRGHATDPAGREPIRLFSRAALPLVAVGLATGLVNTGLVLPSIDALWQSTWGLILLIKVGVLVLVLLLAARHRHWLRRHTHPVGTALRGSVRIETVLAALVVLGGVLLALSAPSIESKGELTSLDLGAPFPGNRDYAEVVHLVIEPATAGQNEFRVYLSPADQPSTVSATQVDRVRLTLTSLMADQAQQQVTLDPDETGMFVAQGMQLSLDGWWQADVLVRRPGLEDVITPFYFLLPDPNVHGFSAPPIPPSSPEAEQMAQAAFAQIAGIRSVHYTERLTSGRGTAAFAERRLSVGFDGNPPTSLLTSQSIEILTVGDQTWQRIPGQPWVEKTAQEIFPPSEWLAAYAGATGFTLGRQTETNGHLTRVLSFYVPETDQQLAAWYAFWIDETSGHVVQETMVSRQHYMLYTYGGFDQPVVIPVPESSQATPLAQ